MDHDPLPRSPHIPPPHFLFCHQFALAKLSYALGMIFFFFATESIWDIMVMIMEIDRMTLHLLFLSIFPREDPAVCSWWRHPVNKPSAAVAPLKSRLVLTAENKIEGIIKIIMMTRTISIIVLFIHFLFFLFIVLFYLSLLHLWWISSIEQNVIFDGHPLFFPQRFHFQTCLEQLHRHDCGKIQAKVNVGRTGLELKSIQKLHCAPNSHKRSYSTGHLLHWLWSLK